ncbi:MAG: carbohydrate-binding family 9-like protein [Deltaproteobacteria bacterium]|nr:carbohydrate-binding family 9-like protein [Deltaproteobacteria bacterium]
MIAIVKRLAGFPKAGTDWDKPPWEEIRPERVGNYMGEKPDHFPRTEVKIAYAEKAVHVLFRVEDRYVRAVSAKHQDPVCRDSCVEFFFTPGPDLSQGYFNLEMNCGGTLLFHFHRNGREGGIEIPGRDCDKLVKTHSLPRIIDPEIAEPVTWTVGYAIPTALLSRYCPVSAPRPKALWRANFYKCADGTSHPHWLTWAPVDDSKPNFHLPQSFGLLAFE